MILSTGFSSMKDVTRTYKYIEKNHQFLTFTMYASYPCKTKDLNLNVITAFKKSLVKFLLVYHLIITVLLWKILHIYLVQEFWRNILQLIGQ